MQLQELKNEHGRGAAELSEAMDKAKSLATAEAEQLSAWHDARRSLSQANAEVDGLTSAQVNRKRQILWTERALQSARPAAQSASEPAQA